MRARAELLVDGAAATPDLSTLHLPVLRDQIMALAGACGPLVMVDATLGLGGHSEALLEANPNATLLAIDRDERAIALASERLSRFGQRVLFVHGTFGDLAEHLQAAGLGKPGLIVADLGVSSLQLDDGLRGMSFRSEGPLDMRMDPSQGETALELIERLSQAELADVIFHFGEERRSRRVARCIKLALEDDRLASTLDLRKAVVRAVGPARIGGVDPATRTFQALRIAVNRELDQLASLLANAPGVLETGGLLAIISFHSLEDRLVKRAFHDHDIWEPLAKKPIVAEDSELASNPRSRSAKLRAARRIDPSCPPATDRNERKES